MDGKWVTIIPAYLCQRAKKGVDARLENGLMFEEMGEFIVSRVSMGRGIVIMGNFNATVGEAVGDGEGSRNQEKRDLVEWVEARDLRILNRARMASGRWSWVAGERSVIDYIMIVGVLGEEDIIEMRVDNREGADVPSDHKLIWVHIAGRGVKCDEGRQEWNGVCLCPEGHISCPAHFASILCNSCVIINYVVIWIFLAYGI